MNHKGKSGSMENAVSLIFKSRKLYIYLTWFGILANTETIIQHWESGHTHIAEVILDFIEGKVLNVHDPGCVHW